MPQSSVVLLKMNVCQINTCLHPWMKSSKASWQFEKEEKNLKRVLI